MDGMMRHVVLAAILYDEHIAQAINIIPDLSFGTTDEVFE